MNLSWNLAETLLQKKYDAILLELEDALAKVKEVRTDGCLVAAAAEYIHTGKWNEAKSPLLKKEISKKDKELLADIAALVNRFKLNCDKATNAKL